MTVTAIREITKSRVLVSVDETFAFVLYKGELRSYGLKEGQEITEEAYRDIMENLLPRRAKLRAMNLLKNRDGLMLGICNGFQALIKLGLVPYGEIRVPEKDMPTLTFNTIGRHISRMAITRIASNKSPWLSKVNCGDLHTVALSHGEGRFIASPEQIKALAENGYTYKQILQHYFTGVEIH